MYALLYATLYIEKNYGWATNQSGQWDESQLYSSLNIKLRPKSLYRALSLAMGTLHLIFPTCHLEMRSHSCAFSLKVKEEG
jgi:hypothetical protein